MNLLFGRCREEELQTSQGSLLTSLRGSAYSLTKELTPDLILTEKHGRKFDSSMAAAMTGSKSTMYTTF